MTTAPSFPLAAGASTDFTVTVTNNNNSTCQFGELEITGDYETIQKFEMVIKTNDNTNVYCHCVGITGTLGYKVREEFFPLGRNQDGAFGYAINGCLEQSLIGYFDFAVYHSPLEPRNYSKNLSEIQMRINDLIVLIWVKFLKESHPKNHEEAGLYFIEFAKEKEFIERLKSLISIHLLDRTLSLERKIDKINKTHNESYKTWLELASHERELTFRASQNVSQQYPMEANADTALVMSWLKSYGELLLNWKAIRKIAKSLNDN